MSIQRLKLALPLRVILSVQGLGQITLDLPKPDLRHQLPGSA
jgi:hypothetical protein